MMRRTSRLESKSALKATVSTAALALFASLGVAPQALAQEAAAASNVEEVVVTGSRVQRNGFTAPTPTTMIGAEDIQKAAPTNIADYVNQMPQAAASFTPRTTTNSQSTPIAGLNLMNLRGLGPSRTLVLLDGQRVVPSTTTGGVDVNGLPTNLVNRIDMVTGGASAAYGSDAVAGVVNFIIDKEFVGLKGSVAAGNTTRWDDKTWNADISYGREFANGRGHILATAEYGWNEGINLVDPNERDWFKSCHLLAFSGQTPARITRCDVNLRTIAQGGVITTTALANTAFGAGGLPYAFVVGTPNNATFMVGGNDWQEGNWVSIDPRLERWASFARVSYELTDSIEGAVDASYGVSKGLVYSSFARLPGTGTTALVMNINNPFIPASTAALGRAAGVTTFNMGYSGWDYGRPVADSERTTLRIAASLAGTLSNGWKWDGYYQYGHSEADHALRNSLITANFRLAIDAVRDSAGNIVCRSTLTAPTNGCVPYNVFGTGVASPQAIDYVMGDSVLHQEITQHVVAGNISGEPFSTWAGPVSVAAGAEYRKESITGTSDALSQANAFFTGNFKPTFGSINVKEGYVEAVAPLAADMPFLQKLELNGAIRYTDYNLAGSVTTWKAGLSWTPIEDLRVRGVLSRDIRAPNFGEVFLAGQAQRQDVFDRTRPGEPFGQIQRITSGNPNLTPEKADTTSFGVVYRPSWLSQLSLSVDYYSIEVNGAIVTPTSQEIVDRCARGETSLCTLLVRDANGVLIQVLGVPVNLALQKNRGFDYEVSFRQDVGPGRLTARVLLTNTIDFYTVNNNIVTNLLGNYQDSGANNLGSIPEWRWMYAATYDVGPASITATARGFGDGVYDREWTNGVQIDNNKVKGTTYVDLAGTYRIVDDGDRKLQAFFKIENLLDKDPSLMAGEGLSNLETNRVLFDTLGRRLRLGIRFEY